MYRTLTDFSFADRCVRMASLDLFPSQVLICPFVFASMQGEPTFLSKAHKTGRAQSHNVITPLDIDSEIELDLAFATKAS